MKSIYDAPALQKGLDVLEYLSTAPDRPSLTELARRLNRTTPELYRTVLVLNERGYVDMDSQGIALTGCAFDLALRSTTMDEVLRMALPVMDGLSQKTLQSCYLTVSDGRDAIVVVTQESPGFAGFTVRTGTRRPVTESTAGLVHYAFLSPARKADWRAAFAHTGAFEAAADEVAKRGWAEGGNPRLDMVTDLAFPIFTPNGDVLALSIPFVRQRDGLALEPCRRHLDTAAKQVTDDLDALYPAARLRTGRGHR